AIRAMGVADHPFDLETGQAQDATVVERRLSESFATLETLAQTAQLPAASQQRLAKARRVLPGLVAAVAFFWLRVRAAARRHYSLHRLSQRKLATLTALHNYWLKRGGTTAAERFFGKKPEDMFEWLLKRLPLPARPARQRLQAA